MEADPECGRSGRRKESQGTEHIQRLPRRDCVIEVVCAIIV